MEGDEMELGKMVLMMMMMLMMIPMMPVMMVMTMVMNIHSGRWSPRKNLATDKPFSSLAEFHLAAAAKGKICDPPRVFYVEGSYRREGEPGGGPGARALWWCDQGGCRQVAALPLGGPPLGLLLSL